MVERRPDREVPEVSEATLRKQQARHYLETLCQYLVKNNLPAYKLTEYMARTSNKLHTPALFRYIPGIMHVSYIGEKDEKDEHRTFNCQEGDVDLSKLYEIHRLNLRAIKEPQDLKESHAELVKLLRKTPHRQPWYLYAIMYTVVHLLVNFLSGMCMAIFGYQASPREWVFTGFCCLPVLLIQNKWVTKRLRSHEVILTEVGFVFLLTIFIKTFSSLVHGCSAPMLMAPLAFIIPTSDFVTSGLEILSGSHVLGATRMIRAMIRTLCVQFGIVLGGSLWGHFHENTIEPARCSAQNISPWWRTLTVFLFWPCIMVNQNESLLEGLVGELKWKYPRQLKHFGSSFMVALLSVAFSTWTSTLFPGTSTPVPNFIAGVVIGLFGHIYRRSSNGPSAMVMLSPISLQVPSTLVSSGDFISGLAIASEAYRGVGSAPVQDLGFPGSLTSVDPSAFIFRTIGQLIQNCLGISLGLMVGSWLFSLICVFFEWNWNGGDWDNFESELLDF